MTYNKLTTQRWSSRPLCRRYTTVQFGCLQIAAELSSLNCTWAVGVTGQLESEILGWWLTANSEKPNIEALGRELHRRGLECTELLVDDNEHADIGEAPHEAFVSDRTLRAQPTPVPESRTDPDRFAAAIGLSRAASAKVKRLLQRTVARYPHAHAALLGCRIEASLERCDNSTWNRLAGSARPGCRPRTRLVG